MIVTSVQIYGFRFEVRVLGFQVECSVFKMGVTLARRNALQADSGRGYGSGGFRNP